MDGVADDGGRAETATSTVAGEADGVGDGGGRRMATAVGVGSLNGGDDNGDERTRAMMGDGGGKWKSCESCALSQMPATSVPQSCRETQVSAHDHELAGALQGSRIRAALTDRSELDPGCIG